MIQAPDSPAPSTRGAPPSVATSREPVPLEAVIRQVRAAITAEGGSVTVRLEPPELGAVRVELHLRGALLVARLEAERPDVASALAAGLSQLRHSLEAAGILVERLDVTGGGPDQGTGWDRGPREEDRDRGAAADPAPALPARPEAPPPAEGSPVAAIDAWA